MKNPKNAELFGGWNGLVHTCARYSSVTSSGKPVSAKHFTASVSLKLNQLGYVVLIHVHMHLEQMCESTFVCIGVVYIKKATHMLLCVG